MSSLYLKNFLNCGKQVILLMIPNKEKESFTTENKVKSHNKVCKYKNICKTV